MIRLSVFCQDVTMILIRLRRRSCPFAYEVLFLTCLLQPAKKISETLKLVLFLAGKTHCLPLPFMIPLDNVEQYLVTGRVKTGVCWEKLTSSCRRESCPVKA
jgi:hypothetical protein